MQNYVINNGAFTANGNFSGYTALGVRVHLHKRQMESLAWTKNEEITFPFFCIAETKQIGALNADGTAVVDKDGVEVKSERLTALSAFKTKAHADSKLLDVEIAQAIHTQAKASGLSDSALATLANASF